MIEWKINQLLFVDDMALVADSEKLCQLVEEFRRMCRRNLSKEIIVQRWLIVEG